MKPTEELAREWLEEAESIGWYSPCVLENLTALLDRVREEERKRCAKIVQAARAIAAGQATSGCSDSALFLGDVLRRIEEGK